MFSAILATFCLMPQELAKLEFTPVFVKAQPGFRVRLIRTRIQRVKGEQILHLLYRERKNGRVFNLLEVKHDPQRRLGQTFHLLLPRGPFHLVFDVGDAFVEEYSKNCDFAYVGDGSIYRSFVSKAFGHGR